MKNVRCFGISNYFFKLTVAQPGSFIDLEISQA